jgi:hypothetical protein
MPLRRSPRPDAYGRRRSRRCSTTSVNRRSPLDGLREWNGGVATRRRRPVITPGTSTCTPARMREESHWSIKREADRGSRAFPPPVLDPPMLRASAQASAVFGMAGNYQPPLCHC